MLRKQGDELTNRVEELRQRFIAGKITESACRRQMLALLQAETVNTAGENTRAINDLIKTAKAERGLHDSFRKL